MVTNARRHALVAKSTPTTSCSRNNRCPSGPKNCARAPCEARSARYGTFEAPASSGTSDAGGCRRLVPFPVPRDELIGDVTQVVADDVWLRSNPQNIVADPLDQRGFPAGRHGAKRVPVARDKTELRGLNPKLPFDVTVSLARRLMV